MTDKFNQTVLLPDGRLLGYAESGKPGGRPLLCFHGIPGSRREFQPQQAITSALGLHMFTLERPGYGLSDPQPGRSLLDWPHDVVEFVDRLGLSDFDVLGFSGGGPYALACAQRLPHRVTSVTLVSSPAPYTSLENLPENLALFALARDNPQQAHTMLEELAGDGEQLYNLMISSLPETEGTLMRAPELATMYRENMGEAVCQGISGMLQDMALIASDWGFSVEEIACPVQLWHGLNDGLTPPAMGRYLQHNIPDCQGLFLPKQGHFLLYSQWHAILVQLLKAHKKGGV